VRESRRSKGQDPPSLGKGHTERKAKKGKPIPGKGKSEKRNLLFLEGGDTKKKGTPLPPNAKGRVRSRGTSKRGGGLFPARKFLTC